jgi:alpha-L-arabinofuranosidase
VGGSFFQWNLGARGNREHLIMADINRHGTTLASMDGSIESGRWYDVKIEVAGLKVKCYLDGKLLQSAELPSTALPGLFASASRVKSSGELILKVINSRSSAADTKVRISGAKGVAPNIESVVLTGDPDEVNSVEQPDKVAPASQNLLVEGSEFFHAFPAHSLTILKVKEER